MVNKTIHELTDLGSSLASEYELAIYNTTQNANATGKGTILNLLGTSITGLNTTASTLPGAINELDGDIGDINTLIGNTSISSIGDGTLTGAISTLKNNLTPTEITFTPDSSYTTSPLDHVIKIGNICIFSFLGKFSTSLDTWTDYPMGTFSVQAKYRALSVAVDNNMHPVSIQIDADSNTLKARPLAGTGHTDGVRGQIIFIIK